MRWQKALLSSGKLLQSFSRSVSNFPIISLPQPVYHDNSDINMSLYSSVLSDRDRVWQRDKEISSTPRHSRKLTTRERLDLLRDKGSEVIHIGTMAGLNMPYGDILNGSMEVAIVTVCGELCMVSSNDWSFKGGTVYPIGVKKQLRGQEIASQNNLPCVYIADSGGAFLPLQAGLYPDKEHGGRVFRNQAVLSSLGIPQIAVVLGPCTAGGAYIPAMSDEAVIVQDIGTLYIAGPPLVKAATGVQLTAEELGGALVHCSISGCTDHYAHTEEEAMITTRAIVESLSLNKKTKEQQEIEQPFLPGDDQEFARLIPTNSFREWPMMEVVARLVDGSRLHQFKGYYGKGLCTGFARVYGSLVGVIANVGELGWQECLKAAHFIRLCTLRGVPLVFLVNCPSEQGSPSLNLVRARAQMMASLVSAKVPKITLVLGAAYGPNYYAMGCHDDKVLNFDQFDNEEVIMLTSDLCSDGLILPSETRKVISQCLDICTRYQGHNHPAQLSVLRM